ncbi:glycerophosphodiester phosphodiesterase [Propionispira raffinosivorans]|uniref:glycerophosphodiester phosphodiesterase n=1 Tax=Propionispira raffinosivorans TaxID=86959 RepID=UPI00037E3E2A|nr:glycerophosphodiester phosphodiesterase [Propionispira raffinosivorans]
MKKPQVWAHRGASGWDTQYAPENTMKAFQKAWDMKADGIEFDVQLTQDGEIVIVHDERIDRVSDQHGWVKDFSLQELKQMNFGQVHPEYGFTEIPTLTELFYWMQNNKLTMNIELKTGLIYYPCLEEKTLELVRQFGLENRVLYSSFNHYSLKRIKEINPQAEIGLLCGEDFIDIPHYPANLQATAIHPPVSIAKKTGFIEKCHVAGLSVNVWTVDVKTDMKWMCEAGVDAIFTDCPDHARKIADGDYSIIPFRVK